MIIQSEELEKHGSHFMQEAIKFEQYGIIRERGA